MLNMTLRPTALLLIKPSSRVLDSMLVTDGSASPLIRITSKSIGMLFLNSRALMVQLRFKLRSPPRETNPVLSL